VRRKPEGVGRDLRLRQVAPHVVDEYQDAPMGGRLDSAWRDVFAAVAMAAFLHRQADELVEAATLLVTKAQPLRRIPQRADESARNEIPAHPPRFCQTRTEPAKAGHTGGTGADTLPPLMCDPESAPPELVDSILSREYLDRHGASVMFHTSERTLRRWEHEGLRHIGAGASTLYRREWIEQHLERKAAR